jgi:hypothetical protein
LQQVWHVWLDEGLGGMRNVPPTWRLLQTEIGVHYLAAYPDLSCSSGNIDVLCRQLMDLAIAF